MKNEFLKGVCETFIIINKEKYKEMELNWLNNPTHENWDKCMAAIEKIDILRGKLKALS